MQGVDDGETFAPGFKYISFSLLCPTVAQLDLQLD